jgi:hypothetical protein
MARSSHHMGASLNSKECQRRRYKMSSLYFLKNDRFREINERRIPHQLVPISQILSVDKNIEPIYVKKYGSGNHWMILFQLVPIFPASISKDKKQSQ